MRNVQVKSATPEEAIQTRFASCGFFERWSIFNEAKASNTSLNFFYVVLGKNIKNNEAVFKTLLKNRYLEKDIFKTNMQYLKYYKTYYKFTSLLQTRASDYRLNKLHSTAEKHKNDYYVNVKKLANTYGLNKYDIAPLEPDAKQFAKKANAYDLGLGQI